ncbi:MAG: class SAM-dependent methyltransferase [Paenibacillus sp.]|nr:class SAM-dependent methyltransferase [Paenibacillus sp.]
MNEAEYKHFYDRVGKINGWNFSHVGCVSEGVKWDFYQEVSANCKQSDLLLDIGTGGAEALLSMTDAALFVVGIDQSMGMVEAANANLQKSGKSNIRVLHMDAEEINFPDGFFNVVSCRHSPFFVNEVVRVLANDGIFLTQQVSEGDKFNLKQAFGRGQSFGIQDGTSKHQYMSQLRIAGFKEVQSFEYDATEYYKSYEDVIFLLKHTPIIPNFGANDTDFAVLEKCIELNQTDKGIMTNSKRYMIIAKK